ENLGDVEALAELATIELASKIGSDGIEAFQDLETELDEFDRLVGHLMISLQAFLAGPLGNFLEIINATLGKKVTQGTIDRLAGSLQDPADQAKFRAAAKERIGTELEIQGFGPFGLPKSAEVLKSAPLDLLSELSRDVAGGKFGKSNLLSRPLRITQEDRESITPKTDTQSKIAQRLLEASQRRIKILELETAEIKQITSLKDKIAAAELVGDKRGVARLKRDQALARLKSDEEQAIARINTKLSEQQQNLERQSIEAKGVAQAAEIRAEFERDIAEIIDDTNKKFEDQMAHQEELRQKINEQESAYMALNDTFRTGIVDAILAAVEGSESLRDSLLGVIQSMARLILQQQLLNALSGFSFFGGGSAPSLATSGTSFSETLSGGFTPKDFFPGFMIGGKALGGSVSANKPYMVGERGPELFVPGAQGNVVPNNAIGSANVVVNVDASGSQAQGNQPNAKALGTAIGAAVQAELVKQKRPGGLLS
ncbi:MAG: hypothetical protein VX964_01435, partial [Verrucomicrobiota bacterium]|nr:hypothetical protein [Verrucomicrobiota bacterium]